MNAVGEQCAGKPPALFDEGALCNGRALLYYFRHSQVPMSLICGQINNNFLSFLLVQICYF